MTAYIAGRKIARPLIWHKGALLVFAGMAIAMGGIIYVLYAPQTLLVFRWIEHLGLTGIVQDLRQRAQGTAPPFHQTVPDGLWVYASTLLFAIPWLGQRFVREAVAWISIPTVLALGAEVGQAGGCVPGTFDPRDMFAYLIGGLLACLQIRGIKR